MATEEEGRRNIEEEQDEVEAHRHPAKGANDEGSSEGGDDEVEAHKVSKAHTRKY
jgi:hypothetical protein